jgi:RNase H-fold protein (predicted Holliday junction resolvase)
MEQKYILALDVSTSTVGISLFEDMGDHGKLTILTHFEPNIRPEPETQLERLKEKADLCVEKLFQDFGNYNIVRIVVEKPLLNSMTQKIAKLLEIFNEYLTNKLSKKLNVPVDFITVDEARRFALPELMGKNQKMMSDFPKKIANLGKNEWSKFLIMYLVSQRYPRINWLLNNALKVNKKNFDRADSVVAGLGFMIKDGYWAKMGDISYWDGNFSYERCVEIIEKNVAYEKFANEHIDKNKMLSPEEKLKVKRKYLNEEFKIQEFLNVEV